MNRPIKFRAWDEKNKRMTQPYFEITTHEENVTEKRHDLGNSFWIKAVMQFTGQHDMNKTEIYEGDICRIIYHHDRSIPDVIGVVKWIEHHSHFSIVANGTCYSLNFKTGGNFGDKNAIEVIGNIYQHAEKVQN